MSAVEKRIFDELVKFKNLEAIQPLSENDDKKIFLNASKWSDSVLSDKGKERTEQLLLEFTDIFKRHRLDIGYTHKFSVKLTPDTNRPVYSKTQRISIHLKDDSLVELALLQYYGVITTLPFSHYSSQIFAKRKLRILADLKNKPSH